MEAPALLEVMPIGISLSPTLLKTMRLLARRDTVARIASTLAWKFGWSASMETTSGVSAGTDLRLGFGVVSVAGLGILSEDEDAEVEDLGCK